MKDRSFYLCQHCGHRSSKWLGRCPGCDEWETFVEETAAPAVRPRQESLRGKGADADPVPLPFDEISSSDRPRILTGIGELDRVLGGGIVPGSLVLLGGEPGVGKSTLLLQAAAALSSKDTPVLYVSGEESERQIKLRGERMGITAPGLFILAETHLERIERRMEQHRPAIVIVDSIQTVFTTHLESAPGSIGQIRECAARLLTLAKSNETCIFLIGHVTKDGAIAGPKALEHIVDTVLYFEGERHHSHRIIRAVKNRFGSTGEVAVFEMTGRGLVEVGNPSALFLAERPLDVPGAAVICSIEGTRPLLVEAQALVSISHFTAGRRMTQGFDRNRLSLLLAMLERATGATILGADVYLNMAGGMDVTEPAADLGVVAAVVGSYRNRAIPQDIAFFGEVGLAGEVRSVPQAPLRIKEVAAMGFRRLLLPTGNAQAEAPDGLEFTPLRHVNEMMDFLF